MATQKTQQDLGNTALLGEASHGTHEFYRERAEITKRLITEKDFTAVAVEADWPDAWMWRNTVVRDFVEWLRDYNIGLSPLRQVGFYGLDLYSLFSSIQAVLTSLDDVDPEAARRARYRYAASFSLKPSCEDEVVQQLREMNRRVGEVLLTPGLVRNAEEYYSTMFHRRVSSWNLRDASATEMSERGEWNVDQVWSDREVPETFPSGF